MKLFFWGRLATQAHVNVFVILSTASVARRKLKLTMFVHLTVPAPKHVDSLAPHSPQVLTLAIVRRPQLHVRLAQRRYLAPRLTKIASKVSVWVLEFAPLTRKVFVMMLILPSLVQRINVPSVARPQAAASRQLLE